jgi:C4-dicarboxylate-specific signal transduction histidine kinase
VIDPTEDRDSDEQRTARLLEKLLQVARTSALEEMASGMAHELNQPIGAIATFAQAGQRMLLRPDPMIDAAAEVLGHISSEALQAGQGIHRIRNLFNGREVARESCHVAEVVTELLPVLHVLASRSGAHIAADTAHDLPAVLMDRLRIQHVLFTLVQNALEAPRREGVPPGVGIEVTGDRYAVRVAITDRGTGVSDEIAQGLFRPFFTTKRTGTGLGLASSRAIVEAHGGAIGFENVAGSGARFWFRLPAATTEALR